ncbi:hypothetical protein Tco_0956870 [Tanacetum coccineum]
MVFTFGDKLQGSQDTVILDCKHKHFVSRRNGLVFGNEVLDDSLCESGIGHVLLSFSTGFSVVNLSDLIKTCSFSRKAFVDDGSKGSPWLVHKSMKDLENITKDFYTNSALFLVKLELVRG